MKRRGATLVHTMVLLTSAMIAAGGVAAFSTYTYNSVAEGERRAMAEMAISGAVDMARYDIVRGVRPPGTATYNGGDRNVALTISDNAGSIASTYKIAASVTIQGRTYKQTRIVGVPAFPESDSIIWKQNPSNGRWYALVTIPAGITWTNAQANAEITTSPSGKPSYLATITDQAEHDWVVSNFGVASLDWTWLGGFQEPGANEPAGDWQWVTGEPFVFNKWWSGEPNNVGGEHHLHYWSAGGGSWNDIPGQYLARTAIIESGDVPNWVYNSANGHYYAYMPAPIRKTWDQADARTPTYPTPDGSTPYMATIDTQEEMQFVRNIVGNYAFGSSAVANDFGPWVGGRQASGGTEPSGGWTWDTGETIFNFFGSGDVNNTFTGGVNEDRLQMMNTAGVPRLNDLPQSEIYQAQAYYPRGYFIEAGPTIQWRTDASSGRSYAFVPTPVGLTYDQALTWAAQLRDPTGRTAYMATLTSAAETTFVQSNFPSMFRTVNASYAMGPWIGGFYNGSAWGWQNSEGMAYTRWGSGKPDSVSANNRLTLFRDGSNTVWWDDLLNSHGTQAANASFYVTGFLVEAGDPPQWFQYSSNGHWYLYVPSPMVTWTAAKAAAATQSPPDGGTPYLATFTSQAEQDYVLSQLPSSAWTMNASNVEVGPWIGLTQLMGATEPTGGWRWDNGERHENFTRWLSGEPNNAGGTGTVNGSREEYGHVGKSGGVAQWIDSPNTPYGGWPVTGYIVESGQVDEMRTETLQWGTDSHPDRLDNWGVLAQGMFNSQLGSYGLPVKSASATMFTDVDGITSETLWWTPGDRGSNRIIDFQRSTRLSVPTSWNSDTNFLDVTRSRARLSHSVGSFNVAAGAISGISMTLSSDNQSWLFINGRLAIDNGGVVPWHSRTLSDRTMISEGHNRIDVFFADNGSPGLLNFASSVAIKPFAPELAQVHPFQYSFAHGGSAANFNSSALSVVDDNAYFVNNPTNLAASSSASGYVYTRAASAPTNLPAAGQVFTSATALTFPTFTRASYSPVSTSQVANGTTLGSRTFSASDYVVYSAGTVTIADGAVFTGQGTIVAETIIVAGNIRLGSESSSLALISPSVQFGASASSTAVSIDAFVYANALTVRRPTTVIGAVAVTGGYTVSSSTHNLTVQHRDFLWRNRYLSAKLKVPGYWTPVAWSYNSTTGNYYAYVSESTSMTWTTMRDRAAAMIGPNGESVHMATVADSAENLFMWNLIPGSDAMYTSNAWMGPRIGFRAPADQGHILSAFTWVTGQAVTFNAFGSGQPDQPGQNIANFCNQYGPGGWDNQGETDFLTAYMVETRALP